MKDILKYRKSYKAGLLQAKAFRILKHRTNLALSPFKVNATDWGVLGMLIEAKEGVQLRAIAEEVGVKQPYITKSIANLTALGYVETQLNKHDTRARDAYITEKGRDFAKMAEKVVVGQLKVTFAGVSMRSLYGYVKTLDTVVTNFSNMADGVDLDHLVE